MALHLHGFPMSVHDATLGDYSSHDRDIVFSIVNWDGTTLKLRCREAVFLKVQEGENSLDNLIECGEREFLREFKEHLARIGYAAIHVEQYRHFRHLDNSNFPVLDVICKEVVEEEPGQEPQTAD